MAQNVIIAGATFSDVPAVDIPKSGGGSARFVDSTDANASASDILQGKSAYVNGSKVIGTGEIGGGGDYNIVTTPASSSQKLDITYIQRGNENLFRSSFYNTTNLVTISDSSSFSKIGYKIATASSLTNINCNIMDTSVLIYETQTYTLSFIAKAGGSGCRLCCDLFPDSYGTSIGLPNDNGVALTTSYQKFSFSGTIQNSTGAFVASTKFRFWALAGEHPYDIYISDIKFEVGSTATDWCPSPYDISISCPASSIIYNNVPVPTLGHYDIDIELDGNAQHLGISSAQKGNENLLCLTNQGIRYFTTVYDSSGSYSIAAEQWLGVNAIRYSCIALSSSYHLLAFNGILDNFSRLSASTEYRLSYDSSAELNFKGIADDSSTNSIVQTISLISKNQTSYGYHYVYRVITKDSLTASSQKVRFGETLAAGESVLLANIKFELGTQATEWTPSHTDIFVNKTVSAISYNGTALTLPSGASVSTGDTCIYLDVNDVSIRSSTETQIGSAYTSTKSGSFKVKHVNIYRSSTSGTWSVNVYKNDVLQGSAVFSGSNATLNVSITLAVGDTVKLKGRSRSSSYELQVCGWYIVQA